jgi:hypothetical protein
VCIIDHAQDRIPLREKRQHGQRRGGDTDRLGLSVVDTERGPQGLTLDRRDASDRGTGRMQELTERRERDLGGGLEPCDAKRPHAARRVDRVLQERALTDPWLAVEDERSAPAPAGVGEQSIEASALRLAADQDVHGHLTREPKRGRFACLGIYPRRAVPLAAYGRSTVGEPRR